MKCEGYPDEPPSPSVSRFLADASLQAIHPAGIVLGGSALAASARMLRIPLTFTPVPLSLQPFAVLVLGAFAYAANGGGDLRRLSGRGGGGACRFSHPLPGAPGRTGASVRAHRRVSDGLSAGRGAHFLAVARARAADLARLSCSAAAGDVVILMLGALWLAVMPHFIARPAMALAVLPFLPGDALKIAAAAAAAGGCWRLRRQLGLTHQ